MLQITFQPWVWMYNRFTVHLLRFLTVLVLKFSLGYKNNWSMDYQTSEVFKFIRIFFYKLCVELHRYSQNTCGKYTRLMFFSKGIDSKYQLNSFYCILYIYCNSLENVDSRITEDILCFMIGL